MSSDHKHQIAQECLESLRAQYGRLDPKDNANESSWNTTLISSFFGRQSRPSQQSPAASLRRPVDQLLPQNTRQASNHSLRSIASQGHANGAGADIHAGISRTQSVSSTPSRWAPSVSEYQETIPEIYERPRDRRPFHERMAVLRENGVDNRYS
ncbi:hypothetical protein RRF57_009334 [Xylaria bambusicola]|uniref:Uncharacterized protein n=1 Tax=Xylaria bambusicola TaxID=326684 RepID=A0AAN7Z1I2_9PEZI